jgi:hypothetical protein
VTKKGQAVNIHVRTIRKRLFCHVHALVLMDFVWYFELTEEATVLKQSVIDKYPFFRCLCINACIDVAHKRCA